MVFWEVCCDARKDTDEVLFEGFDGYLSDVAAMAVWGNQFQFAFLFDECFHAL